MSINSCDIKVEVNYPNQDYWSKEIESIKAKWILEQQIELYGEINLSISYPIWIRIKELESKGITYEEAKKTAIREYVDN
ncbi:MAG: hypothetical protein RR942_06935 [Romboutsia sp.]